MPAEVSNEEVQAELRRRGYDDCLYTERASAVRDELERPPAEHRFNLDGLTPAGGSFTARPPAAPDTGDVDAREAGGRLVREVWIEWAREQPNPKASWLAPWEGLSEPDREVDRRIAERVAAEARRAERRAVGDELYAMAMPQLQRIRRPIHFHDFVSALAAFVRALRDA